MEHTVRAVPYFVDAVRSGELTSIHAANNRISEAQPGDIIVVEPTEPNVSGPSFRLRVTKAADELGHVSFEIAF